jgi:hypothetical protein
MFNALALLFLELHHYLQPLHLLWRKCQYHNLVEVGLSLVFQLGLAVSNNQFSLVDWLNKNEHALHIV